VNNYYLLQVAYILAPNGDGTEPEMESLWRKLVTESNWAEMRRTLEQPSTKVR